MGVDWQCRAFGHWWLVHSGIHADVMLHEQADVIAGGSDTVATVYFSGRNVGTG